MKIVCALMFCSLLLGRVGMAAAKPHMLAFGKWTTLKWMVGEDEHTPVDLKMRPLLVDGQTKEFTTGQPHEVTDQTFVVQRVIRLNDSLASQSAPARWHWERGGWVLVNRVTGKLKPVPLPEFDPYYSAAEWFRDYAAYCGISDDGKKVTAIIVQLGRRKPLLRKTVRDLVGEMPASQCPAPVWQREPSRVTFAVDGQPNASFTIPAHGVDLAPKEDNAGEAENHGRSKPSGACSTARRTK